MLMPTQQWGRDFRLFLIPLLSSQRWKFIRNYCPLWPAVDIADLITICPAYNPSYSA